MGEQHARLAVAAPLALVAGHFAPLVPGQGAHRAVGQCADAAGEGARTRPRPPARGKAHQDEAAGGALDQGRPSRWPRFLPMIRPPPPSSPVPPGRQLSGRPPGQPHAHDLGAHNPADGRSTSARPAAGGSTIPCSYEAPPPMACGSTCTVASWLIVRPPAAGEPAHGTPPPPPAPGLEAPADPAGRAHPGDRTRHGTAEQGRHRGRAPWDGRADARPCAPHPRPSSTRRRPHCA